MKRRSPITRLPQFSSLNYILLCAAVSGILAPAHAERSVEFSAQTQTAQTQTGTAPSAQTQTASPNMLSVEPLTLTMDDLQSLEAQSAEKDLNQLNALAQALKLDAEDEAVIATKTYAGKWLAWEQARKHLEQSSQYGPKLEKQIAPAPPEPTLNALKDYYQQVRLAEEHARSQELAQLEKQLEMDKLKQKQLELLLEQEALEGESNYSRRGAVGGLRSATGNQENRFLNQRREERNRDFYYYDPFLYGAGCGVRCNHPNHKHPNTSDSPLINPPKAEPSNFIQLRDLGSYSRMP
ncbi:MAG: hypothetical protein ACFCU1_10425 [Sumerlaeia bacterium]